MKRAKIMAYTVAGEKEVAAFLVDDAPGLAVHRAIGGPGFTVTHVGSGYRAHRLPFPTQATAVAYASDVGAMFDCSATKAELQSEMRDDPDNAALLLTLEQAARDAR